MTVDFLRHVRGAAAAALASVAMFAGPGAHAAAIGITPSYPDLTTSSATLTYTYTQVCQNSSGSSIGSCGSGGRNTIRWDLSYGRLTLTRNGSQILNPDGSGILPVSDNNGASFNYDLTVIFGFNNDGTALSGILASDPYSGDALYSSSLAAYGLTTNLNFQSGTLVTGTPTDATGYGYAYPFGYAGSGAAGVFEFVFNNVGGDFAAFGGAGGIIISTFNLTGVAGSWDAAGVGFWKTGHSGTAAIDTVVPVPGALWLLGSACAGLGALRRRVRAT